MQVTFTGIVREVFPSDKRPEDYVTFYDRDSGGDVKLTFDRGSIDLIVGAELKIDATVKGRQYGNSIGYKVLQVAGQKKPVAK